MISSKHDPELKSTASNMNLHVMQKSICYFAHLEKKQKINPRMRILFLSRRFPPVRLEKAWENAVKGLGSN